MSLDIALTCEHCGSRLFDANITHNLTDMAEEAGIYKHCWRPEEIGITRARDLIEPLRAAIALMESDPERFKRFNPENGWGSYEDLLRLLHLYADACEADPDATIRVSR